MIVFNRKAGTLSLNGKTIAGVWSGHGDAHNDPSREREKGVGPLPAGIYSIGRLQDGGHLGPEVMRLTMVEGDAFGRDGFFIHGDHPADWDWSASDGCIIASRLTREWIDAQSDRRIQVI
jgi:hypothetical protein